MKKYLLAAALAVIAAPAHAGFLGKTVRTQYLFPDQDSNYELREVTVGAGIEAANVIGTFDLDISDNNVTAKNFGYASTWTTIAFNGWAVRDFNDTVAQITGVSINAATNMAGFDMTRVSFDDNNVYVNWQGLSFATDTVVSLDITTADDVPEPAMLGLFGLGALALGLKRRRKA